MSYTYDADNRMSTVTDWLTNQTSYAYDDAGNLTTTTYPNGVSATDTYDNANRLLSVTNANTGTFSSFTYTLDAVGNRTQMVATGAGAGTTTYSYDSLDRLTSVTYPGPTTDTYTYDAIGNRTAKNSTSYTYDDANEMTAAGGVSYTYDANGNQTGAGSDTFTYDHENRLTQSVVGGVTSSSVYDGNGLRLSHTVNGTTTAYTWDAASKLPVVIQDGTYSYVYGLDLISMTDGSGTQHYLSYDGLGSVSDLTDGTGAVTDTFVYDAFGAVTARTGTTATAWKFTGEQADDGSGDTGYYFLRARYYDPTTGRFISRDPVGFAQRYAYAQGNPALLTDPTGLCSLLGIQCHRLGAGAAIVGSVLGGAAATCEVASLGGASLGCGALAVLAVGANLTATGFDVASQLSGDSEGGWVQVGLDLGVAGASVIIPQLPETVGLSVYAHTVAADAVAAGVAGREFRQHGEGQTGSSTRNSIANPHQGSMALPLAEKE